MSGTIHSWVTKPLGELAAEMCLGKMLDKEKNRGTFHPYLRNVNVRWFSFDMSDLKEMRFEEREGDRFDLRSGDLVICEGGEPGRAAVWNGQAKNAKIQKALHRIRFHANEYDPHFAMYYVYFGTITNRFARYYTGTTIKHLTGAALSRVQFPIPPINEQRRVVAKIEELFSDLDAGVAALERARANLKRYRASVLKAAVEGSLTAEWRAKRPNTEPASKLLERILTERRKKWEADQLAKFAAAGKQPPKGWREKYVEPKGPDTSGLPELPKGWCWASVEQIVSSEPYSLAIGPFGSNLKVNDYRDDGVPLVFVRNIRSGVFGVNGTRYVSTKKAAELSAHGADGGDILITKMGEPPGDACLYPIEQPRAIITADCIKLRLHLLLQAKAFFVNAINSHLVRAQVLKITKGVAQQKVSLGRFSTVAVPLPPTSEQPVIVDEVAEKFSQIDAAEAAIEHGLQLAARLRQSILKVAFEGKLVPQDPADEPAGVMLERIERGNDRPASSKRPKAKHKR